MIPSSLLYFFNQGNQKMPRVKQYIRDFIRDRKTKNVNFKTTPEIHAAICKKAQSYAGGNITAWLEFIGSTGVPSKKYEAEHGS
jgi:SRSO17 transposase